MKKSLSVVLSLVMILTTFMALPLAAPAIEPGISPNDLDLSGYGQYEEEEVDLEQGAGYIRVDDSEGEEGGAEIVNLFHSEEVTSYKGVSYDLKTNTLTLDNVKGTSFSVQCDQMFHMTIVVKGTCVLGGLGFWETYPVFAGTGTLTVNSQIGVAATRNLEKAGISPVTVGKDVTVKLNKGEADGCGTFSVTTNSATTDTSKLITYAGKVSATPQWQLQYTEGGPADDWISLSNVRTKTVFKATMLLKKKDYQGENNYWVKSISHVGNQPLLYHYVSQLEYRDGFWYETNRGQSYWNQDSLFESFSNEEIAAMPSSLVDQNGDVTAYLSTQSDYGQAYVKNDRVFIFLHDSRFCNIIVNPSYPADTSNSSAPDVLVRLLKNFSDTGINLVDFEAEYDISESANYSNVATRLSEDGYAKFTKYIVHPYCLAYNLTNASLTFSPAAVAKTAISKCTIATIKSYTYTGKAIKPAVTVKYNGKTLKNGTDYTVAYKNNTKVGTATVTVTGKGNYTGTKTATFKINKAANTLKASGKTVTVKYSAVKKKAQTVKKDKAYSVSKAQGTVTFEKSGGNKNITVDKKTGKITVKKGTKKKKYTLKIKVKAAGNANYKSKTTTVTVTVVVK